MHPNEPIANNIGMMYDFPPSKEDSEIFIPFVIRILLIL